MAKINTNISIDANLKKDAVSLFNDFGLDFKKYDGILLLHNVYPQNNYYNMYTLRCI